MESVGSIQCKVEVSKVDETRTRHIVPHLIVREAVKAFDWANAPNLDKSEQERRSAFIMPIVREAVRAKLDDQTEEVVNTSDAPPPPGTNDECEQVCETPPNCDEATIHQYPWPTYWHAILKELSAASAVCDHVYVNYEYWTPELRTKLDKWKQFDKINSRVEVETLKREGERR